MKVDDIYKFFEKEHGLDLTRNECQTIKRFFSKQLKEPIGKVEKVIGDKRYTLTNEGLRVGDEVYPIGQGRCLDGGGWIFHKIDFHESYMDFPNDPHKIINLKHSDYKPYEVRTDHGYGPRETYYKIVKVEHQESIDKNPGGKLRLIEHVWVEE